MLIQRFGKFDGLPMGRVSCHMWLLHLGWPSGEEERGGWACHVQGGVGSLVRMEDRGWAKQPPQQPSWAVRTAGSHFVIQDGD